MTRSSRPWPRWKLRCLLRSIPLRSAGAPMTGNANGTSSGIPPEFHRLRWKTRKVRKPPPLPLPPMIINLTPLPLPPRKQLRARGPRPMSLRGGFGGTSTRSLGRGGAIPTFGAISSPAGSGRTWSTRTRLTVGCCETWRRRWSAPAGRPEKSSRPASSRAGARFTTRTR